MTNSPVIVEKLYRGKPFALWTNPNESYTAAGGVNETLGDFEFKAKFQIHQRGVQEKHPRSFRMAVYDRDGIEPRSVLGTKTDLFSIDLTLSSHFNDETHFQMGVQLPGSRRLTWLNDMVVSYDKDKHKMTEFRLIRIGDQGFIYVNGVRVLRTPLNPYKTNLGFQFRTRGMCAHMYEVEVNRLRLEVASAANVTSRP